MKIAIISDAWTPQVNGVAVTLSSVIKEIEYMGHHAIVIHPGLFKTIPCPTYPEIRLAVNANKKAAEILDSFCPSAIHIATEGPLGLAARAYCLDHKYPFTTSFHTRFPEYIKRRFGIPSGIVYRLLRWFHEPSSAIMVPAPLVRAELEERGFGNTAPWSRGVDMELFRPRPKEFIADPRPIYMYVGRVAVEKNIESFLKLDIKGTKYVVGDGPRLKNLKARYPAAKFTGAKFGEELAKYYAASDVFVFPSRTDTFGLVMLEAMASGVPIAAYPVPGPLDVVAGTGAGCLHENLGTAIKRAIQIPADRCRKHARKYSWRKCSMEFISNLHVFR